MLRCLWKMIIKVMQKLEMLKKYEYENKYLRLWIFY